MKTKTIITTVFAMLFFMNSCTKTNNDKINESNNLPPAMLQFQFTLIDKDSNTYYKYPEVLNTKYDPHLLFTIDQDGDTMKKLFISYKTDSNIIFCNLDTLKKNSVFGAVLQDYKIHLGDNLYYIHYNIDEVDTLLIKVPLYFSKYEFLYNSKSIPFNVGNNPNLIGPYLIIK